MTRSIAMDPDEVIDGIFEDLFAEGSRVVSDVMEDGRQVVTGQAARAAEPVRK